jgi:hypothetical protein
MGWYVMGWYVMGFNTHTQLLALFDHMHGCSKFSFKLIQ